MSVRLDGKREVESITTYGMASSGTDPSCNTAYCRCEAKAELIDSLRAQLSAEREDHAETRRTLEDAESKIRFLETRIQAPPEPITITTGGNFLSIFADATNAERGQGKTTLCANLSCRKPHTGTGGLPGFCAECCAKIAAFQPRIANPTLVAQAVDRMHTAADDAEWVAAAQDLEEAIRQRTEAAEELDLLKWIEETAPETMKAWRESYATQTRIRECLEGR